MATRRNATTNEDVSGDGTAPDGTSATAPETTATVAPTETSVAPTEAPAPIEDTAARAAALNGLLNGGTLDEDETPEPEVDFDPDADVVDFGGRTRAVVVFNTWRAVVDGVFKIANKGTVIRAKADEVDRGEKLGGLRRVETS